MTTEPQSPPQQLVFDLPHLAAIEAEDFLVSTCNQTAVDMISRWPDWPAHAVVIAGPPGSGKTHLASVWRQRSGANAVDADQITSATIENFKSAGVLVIEDIDRKPVDQKMVFHLLNQSREQRGAILLTMRTSPGELDFALPDLRSRLRALPVAEIGPCDDQLLSGLLIKLFADRQIHVDPAVVKYTCARMERSADAARRIVGEIDRLALSSHRKVSRQLAAEALNNLGRDT